MITGTWSFFPLNKQQYTFNIINKKLSFDFMIATFKLALHMLVIKNSISLIQNSNAMLISFLIYMISAWTELYRKTILQ